MKSSAIVIPVILFLSHPLFPQSDSTFSGLSYFLSVHSGGLFGKKGNSSSLSTSAIQGIRYDRLALGVGVGYDAYMEWRTLPVFVSVGYDLFSRRAGAYFLQMNTGYSRAWNPLANENQFTYSEEGGFFVHPVLGYRSQHDKFSLYFTAGYKFQDLTYEQTPNWWVWGHPAGKVTVDREVQRLSVQIGIGLH
jgi:hypothetical protein